MRSKSLVPVVSLVLLALGALALTAAPPKTAKAKPDSTGAIGEHVAAAAAASGPVHACLELHNTTAVFPINVTINPDTYPYTITGGVFGGNLCDAANWTITGTSIGSALTIKGTYHGTQSCATSITISGNVNQPPSYIGTYTFPGVTFNHHTLFLGYVHGTASCP